MRVCVPRFDQAYQFDEGSSRVSGPAAPIGNLFLEVTEGLNVSLLQKDTIGHLIEGSSDLYDGCLGSLQANESDTMVFGLNSYPCLGPNLRNGVVILAERLGLASAYPQINVTTDYKNTHVMDMFASFSFKLWLLVAAFYLASVLLTLLAVRLLLRRRRLDRRNRGSRLLASGMQVLIACLLRQHSSVPSDLLTRKTLSFNYSLTAIASLYLSFYLTSMIKTESVVFKRPFTVESFEELLAFDLRPLWISTFTDSDEFRLAPRGSLNRRLWDRAFARGINESLIETSLVAAVNHAVQIGHQKEAAIFHDSKATVLIRGACAFSRVRHVMDRTNALFRREEGARERPVALTTNTLTPDSVVRHMSRRVQRISQGRLLQTVVDRTDASTIMGISDPESVFSQIETCASGVIEPVHPDLRPIPLRHYGSLFLSVGAGILLATAVMATEYFSTRGSRVYARSAPAKRERVTRKRATASAPAAGKK